MWISELIGRAAAALICLVWFAPAQAIESAWDAAPEARARLISGASATGVAETAPLGLEIVLKDGWKTYWRAPGPQGYPPRLIWDGSENLAGAEIIWPTPKRFEILGFDSIGYTGGVLLPLAVQFKDRSKPAKLRVSVDYLTCAEICIPQMAKLSLDLPAGAATPTAHAFAIDRARGEAPAPAGGGDRIERTWLTGPADQPQLVVEGVSAKPLNKADIFIDGLPGYFFGAPTLDMRADGTFRLQAAAIEVPPEPAAVGETAIYTVRLDDRAIIQSAPLSAPPTDVAPARSVGTGLLLILGVAFLGGLILNIMPCVLPVLAIKLMGALRHVEGGRRAIRRGFAASAAGIVVSFLALAAGAVALQSAGMAVGWGMQFQQPLFVAAMALVMALFAANLWGLFEFSAPAAVNRAAADGPGEPESLSGSFWSGVLATALATPCSAPFVGSALSFALTRGPGEIFAVFFAMGLGLAAPYLATAAMPSLARLLPKPGRWMNTLRRVLGIAVALTGVWLIWILSQQAGSAAAGLAFVAATAIVIGLASFGIGQRWRVIGAGVAVGLAAVWLTAAPPRSAEAGALDWAPFNEAVIAKRVAAGEVVLVDVTADWCVTCKWNKAAVLNRQPVAALLEADVMPMQADWTRPDPAIGAYLAKFGRFGIPFNVVYGPGAPAGVTLPELLSADAVMAAVKKARGPAG